VKGKKKGTKGPVLDLVNPLLLRAKGLLLVTI